MEEFNLIKSLFKEYEEKKISLAQVAGKHGFEKITTEQSDDIPGECYEVYKGQKETDEYRMVIIVETKDKYRSFSANQEEPYINTIELWDRDRLIEQESYTYWK